jgi:cation diffusion facilitator CzcD-associated flavoprotein CzcO
MTEHDVVVVGAGPGGISVALSLRDRGLRPLLVERADHVAAAWRGRYDRLKLNTGRPFSHLPNRRFPRGTTMFPSRDDVVAHLDRHAHEDGIDLRLSTDVQRLDRHAGRWRLTTTTGDIDAREVVVAIGLHHTPRIPQLPGAADYSRPVVHSADYRNAGPYTGKNVLVVGAGSSALEIAYDLAVGGAATVWLAVRTVPHIMLRSLPGGLPADIVTWPLFRLPVRIADAIADVARRRAVGDLTEFGLPAPDEGLFTRVHRSHRVPSLVDVDVIDAIRDRSITVVSAVDAFDADKVVLADGSRLDADAVVLATGYQSGLEPIVGHLAVLDELGMPVRVGEHPAAPGLRFVGFDPRPVFLGHLAAQSKRVARRIAREFAGG